MTKIIMKIICLLLVAASLALLFLPCWTAGEVNVAPAEYIYRPSRFRSLTTELRSVMNTKKLATRNAMPIFVLLALNIVLLVCSILKFKSNAPAICCLVIGMIGMCVCLISPIIRYGTMLNLRIILYGIMILFGLTAAVLCRSKEKKASGLEMPDIRGEI